MSGVKEILQIASSSMWGRMTRWQGGPAHGGDPRGSYPGLEGEQLRGVFSERDLMKRVVLERLDPEVTPVKDVHEHRHCDHR